MVETKFGNFELLKNERDAFDLTKFEEKYLEEYFYKYPYLVGDLADDILRIKGFSTDPKSKAYFHYIPEYITESCAYHCKYYILKRVGTPEEVINYEEEAKEEIKVDNNIPNKNNQNKEVKENNQNNNQQNNKEQNGNQGQKKKKFFRHHRYFNNKKKNGNGDTK